MKLSNGFHVIHFKNTKTCSRLVHKRTQRTHCEKTGAGKGDYEKKASKTSQDRKRRQEAIQFHNRIPHHKALQTNNGENHTN